ncbi:MAG: hypothetical protein KAS23_11280 [Anaerohalosphaera sp.]|nr:hypothetical protein [Anaerohalosphaera sp.]
MLSELEKKVLSVIQHGMPLTLTPYKDMADQLGVSVDDVLGVIKGWKEAGQLRRVGAIVNHFRVGLAGAAMVVWRVEEDRVEEVGKQLASFAEVSHAYERPKSDAWPYNLYTMVHGDDMAEVERTVASMSEVCGVDDYSQLETVRELKKVPPTYISS